MKNRFICSSRCQGLTLLIVLSVLAEPRALFDKRQEPPHCAMAALEEQKVPDAPIQRTPAEDAADLTTLLQKVNPTVDDTIRAAELCTSQLTNLAEFVNAFAGQPLYFYSELDAHWKTQKPNGREKTGHSWEDCSRSTYPSARPQRLSNVKCYARLQKQPLKLSQVTVSFSHHCVPRGLLMPITTSLLEL